MRIKVCGLTREGDVAAVAAAGVDAVGFVFASSSRRVTLDQAASLASRVPPLVARVGVFVNPTAEEVHEACGRVGLDWVQLHGQEPPSFCAQFAPRALKAVAVRAPEDLERARDYFGAVAGLLLDAYDPRLAGGTGRTFEWRWVDAAALPLPVILSGGLTPENVAEAIERVGPWAVDVSSGVESAPGIKDPEAVRRFVAAAREAGSRRAAKGPP